MVRLYIPIFFLLILLPAAGCVITNGTAPPMETISGADAKKEIIAATAIGYYWGVNTTLDSFQPYITKEDYFSRFKTADNAVISGMTEVFLESIHDNRYYTNPSVKSCIENVRMAAMMSASAEVVENITNQKPKYPVEFLSGIVSGWEAEKVCDPEEAGQIIHINQIIEI